jgi:ribonuclease BN (tRNA processing enzyme)
MEPTPIPADRLVPDPGFLQAVQARPEALVYFLCNVGDADAQVLLLPTEPATGRRRVIVVDAGVSNKVTNLLGALDQLLLTPPGAEELVALVVATHPHDDHMAGLPQLLTQFRNRIAEFWDPGYFHTIGAYHGAMTAIEADPNVLYANPTSGFRRWIGNVLVTVLSPSIHLRNRFDTYGTEINDSSISLKVEFPARRVEVRDEGRMIVSRIASRTLVLGADAQTLSWSYVLTDFPFLRRSDTPAAKAIAAATSNADLLRADVLKISHHASKHGVNLELVERIGPKVTLVSSAGATSRWNFPHTITQEIVREALEPQASSQVPQTRSLDYDLRIFYTCDSLAVPAGAATPLGSIALLIEPQNCQMWRFQDGTGAQIAFANALRWAQPLWT